MSLEDRVKATAKNLEGKAQEAMGEITGDPQLQEEGKAKQVEASAMHMAENVKEAGKDTLNALKEKIDNA